MTKGELFRRTLNIVVKNENSGPMQLCHLALLSEISPEDVVAFYLSALPSHGWRLEDESVLGGAEVEGDVVLASKEGARLIVKIEEMPGITMPLVQFSWSGEIPLEEAQRLTATVMADAGPTSMAPGPDGPTQCAPSGSLVPNGAELVKSETYSGPPFACWVELSAPGSATSAFHFYKQSITRGGYATEMVMVTWDGNGEVITGMFNIAVPGKTGPLSISVFPSLTKPDSVAINLIQYTK